MLELQPQQKDPAAMRAITARVRTAVFISIVIAILALIPASERLGASGTWQARPPMPTARLGPSTGVIDGKIYVASGCCVDPLSQFPFRFTSLEIYDPVTNGWTIGAP